MRKNIFVIVTAVLLFLTLANSGCLKDEKAATGKEINVSMKGFEDFMGNYSTNTDNATKHDYFNLTQGDEGDVVILRDEIANISYNGMYNYTGVTFVTDLNHSMPFGGDITQKFAKGDNVEIKFHVITDIFPDPNNPSWTVSIETLQELWNTTRHSFDIISPDVIKKV